MTTADTVLKPIFRLQTFYNNQLIEQAKWKNANLLHSSFIRYDTSTAPTGYAYPGRTKYINLQAPSPTFTVSSVSGNTIAKDSRYIDEDYYVFQNGNPLQTLGKDGQPIAYIWDYFNTYPIAKVTNSTVDQIAFTSFEADGKGRWSFSGTPATDVAAITGSKDYNLVAGNIMATGLDITRPHIISYFSKSGSATVNATSGVLLFSKNGWNYYEHYLSQSASSVTISGSVIIDELRLYPADAQMTSYTYTPLVGMTSACAQNGYINYYEYDGLGRLLRTRDMDKNIIQQYDYKYVISGSTYFNSLQTANFTRNNCGVGYVGSTVAYTVPAGTYGSNASQAAADLQATNDISANGQNYANVNGTCTVSTATITASNPAHAVGYSVKYTNTTTLVATTFTIPSAGGTLGTLPAGTYNIHIGKTGGSFSYVYSVNCNSLSVFATVADFNNVAITPTSCNGVTIDLP